MEEGVKEGKLLDWRISVLRTLPSAAVFANRDTVNFTEFHSDGAAYAVYLKALNVHTGETAEGWVSGGSYLFPYKALRLDSLTSLLMPEREPRRYVSTVKVYTQKGRVTEDTVTVNHPLKIEGWKIYQSGYDRPKGRWSDISVFELVRDPWLPAVYTGIIMMAAGAVFLFMNSGKKKEENIL